MYCILCYDPLLPAQLVSQIIGLMAKSKKSLLTHTIKDICKLRSDLIAFICSQYTKLIATEVFCMLYCVWFHLLLL